MYSKIENFVIDAIINRMEDFKGVNVYGCDLAFTLFNSENNTGAYFCNNYKAKKWIVENFDELGDIMEDIDNNYGAEFVKSLLSDIFNDPDKIVVVVVLEVAGNLLGQCQTVQNFWDDETELNTEIINSIKNELLKLSDTDRAVNN